MSDGMPWPLSSPRTLGPLDRGHRPAVLVSGVLRGMLPAAWACDVIDRGMFGEREVQMIVSDGRRVLTRILDYDAINAGMTAAFCEAAIEALKAPEREDEG